MEINTIGISGIAVSPTNNKNVYAIIEAEEGGVFRSRDGGETWSDWRIVDILPDGPQDTNYGCFAGLVRLPVLGRDIVLYSNCDSASGRKLGTVWVSFDGAKTWPLKRLLWEDPFQYSSLATGRPGTPSEGWIYMHFEGLLPQSHVARFNLSWLLSGTRTGDGVIPSGDYPKVRQLKDE